MDTRRNAPETHAANPTRKPSPLWKTLVAFGALSLALTACGSAQGTKIPQANDGETFGDLNGTPSAAIQSLLGTYTGTLRIQNAGTPAQFQTFTLELTLAGRYMNLTLNSSGSAGVIAMNAAVGVSRNTAGGTLLITEAAQLGSISGTPVAIEMVLLSGESLPTTSFMDCFSLAQPICENLSTRIQFTSDFHKL